MKEHSQNPAAVKARKRRIYLKAVKKCVRCGRHSPRTANCRKCIRKINKFQKMNRSILKKYKKIIQLQEDVIDDLRGRLRMREKDAKVMAGFTIGGN
jgi:hypothetical protein